MAHFPDKYRATARVKQQPLCSKFACGDKVSHAENPRHVGRVDAVWTHKIRVTWECGIREDLHASEPLVLVEPTPEQQSFFWARKSRGPATVAESPKRKLERYFAALHERPAPKPVVDVEPTDLTATIRVVNDRRRRA